MIINIFKYITILLLVILVHGCASHPGISSSTASALTSRTKINDNTIIVLVGVEGPAGVGYIQYCHDLFPCLNYENIKVSNDVIGLVMPVPMKGLELASYSILGKPGFYMASGMSVGYIPIKDEPVNIMQSGIYFHLIIDTTGKSKFTTKPTKEILNRAKEKYGELLKKLEPINFTWP